MWQYCHLRNLPWDDSVLFLKEIMEAENVQKFINIISISLFLFKIYHCILFLLKHAKIIRDGLLRCRPDLFLSIYIAFSVLETDSDVRIGMISKQ